MGVAAQSEYTVVPSDSVVRVPDGVWLEQAATLPMNGLTARRALDMLGLSPGQTLVVTGAAGAVGGYGVQLGVAEGLRVIGVSAAADEALVRGLGARISAARHDVARRRAAWRRRASTRVLDAAVIGRPVLAADPRWRRVAVRARVRRRARARHHAWTGCA